MTSWEDELNTPIEEEESTPIYDALYLETRAAMIQRIMQKPEKLQSKDAKREAAITRAQQENKEQVKQTRKKPKSLKSFLLFLLT